MQMTYFGEHSVCFGDHPVIRPDGSYSDPLNKYSWNDWHLVPTSRPVIVPPPVKKNTIEIIGANSLIDLTEVPRGFPTYGNRTGSLDFYVDHSIPWKRGDSTVEYDWATAFREIKEFLHGQRMNLYLSDEPNWYYTGRFEVKSWKSDKVVSTVSIDYDLDPYSLSSYSTLEEWQWNPFDFLNGTIPQNDTSDYVIPIDSEVFWRSYTGTQIGPMPVIPKFYLSGGITEIYAQVWSSFKGYWSDIIKIENDLEGFEDVRLTFSTPRSTDTIQINFYSDDQGTPATTGTVSIDFRPGRL